MSTSDLLEERIRTTLTTRAAGVEATPQLWERVEHGIVRRRRHRLLSVAALTAAVLAVVAVTGTLLRPAPLEIDVAPEPEDVAPLDGLPPEAAVAVRGDDHSTVHIGATGRRVLLPGVVDALVAVRSPDGGTGTVVAVWEDDGGVHIGGITSAGAGTDPEWVIRQAAPNGAGVVASPTGWAIAWLEGRELVLVGLDSPNMARRVTLGDLAPDDLVLQQWVQDEDGGHALLASRSGDGLWRQRLDPSSGESSAEPLGRPTPIEEARTAIDGAYLPDGTLALLTGPDGTEITRGADTVGLPAVAHTTFPTLATAGHYGVTVVGAVGNVWIGELTPDGSQEPTAQEQLVRAPGITAATPLTTPENDPRPDEPVAARPDGLPPPAGLAVGVSDGTRLFAASGIADLGVDAGAEPFPGLDVELGLVAASPRSSPVHDGAGIQLAVAVVRGDGRHELWHVGYRPDGGVASVQETGPAEAVLVGEPLVLPGAVTGLVWVPGEDRRLVWSTAGSWGIAEATEAGLVGITRATVPLPGPVVDAVVERATDVAVPDGGTDDGDVLSIGFGQLGVGTARATWVELDGGGSLSGDLAPVATEMLLVRLADADGATAVELRAGPTVSAGVSWETPAGVGDFLAPPLSLQAVEDADLRLVPGTGRALAVRGADSWWIELPDGGGRTIRMMQETGIEGLLTLQ